MNILLYKLYTTELSISTTYQFSMTDWNYERNLIYGDVMSMGLNLQISEHEYKLDNFHLT